MQKVTFSGKSNFIIVNSHDIPNCLDNFAVRNALLEIIHSLSSVFIDYNKNRCSPSFPIEDVGFWHQLASKKKL